MRANLAATSADTPSSQITSDTRLIASPVIGSNFCPGLIRRAARPRTKTVSVVVSAERSAMVQAGRFGSVVPHAAKANSTVSDFTKPRVMLSPRFGQYRNLRQGQV